jgi:transposase
MITDRQYQQLVIGQNKGWTLKKNAMKAGVCENTARQYLKNQKAPSEAKKPHTWKTRRDPLEKVWESDIKPLLIREPRVEAVSVIGVLEDKYPDQIWERHLRTLQRRIRTWRWKEGPEKEVFFPQERKPGISAQLDWTHIKELQVTILGKLLDWLLFHLVFPYSNWQWATLCRSESFASLKKGLQVGMKRMGKIPRDLWSDCSSAATHQLSGKSSERGFNQNYLDVCAHFGMRPHTIEVGKPNQNGDVESSNGHLKRRIDQALMIRGSRDFESKEAFMDFVEQLMDKLNQEVEQKRQEELALMRDLPVSDLCEFETTLARVSRSSTITVRRTVYSVPSRLIGSCLRVHLYEDRIEVFFDTERVLHAPRGEKAYIDYRHLMGTLIKKPGAFENYQWQEALYPQPIFRSAYDHMKRIIGDHRAVREYLRILELCVAHGESTIAHLIEEILQSPKATLNSDEISQLLGTYDQMRSEFGREPDLIPDLTPYDQLLETEEVLL